MSISTLDRRLDALEASRYRFGRGEVERVVRLLRRLDATRIVDKAALIRFHEALLFFRAFPQGPTVVRIAQRILNGFHRKVAAIKATGSDMEAFDSFEFCGIAGTEMEDTLSFDVARWLIARLPGAVEIAWESYEPGRELGNTGPRFLPLLEDDASVEADTPWQEWVFAASGKREKGAAEWLISRFAQLPLPNRQKAELYDSLRVPLRWRLDNSAITRTRNWKPSRGMFYHSESAGTALIPRSQVSLKDELARRPPRLKKLSRGEAERTIEMIREVMLVRYRELYGTTLADPRSVVRADLGRGVSIYLWNLPPERRLPLRAYVAGFTLKNGVPINYIEAIGLCEWMEVGFNTFYTFRGGEAGWIYAQVLRCLCHRMGTTCIAVYPYQLGHENEEAIASGAFWFYRKLGFRPGWADLRRLAEREENKIAADPKYRSAARTLKKLASGHAFYELPGSEVGAWDKFSTRALGLRVNRRMARDFGGDVEAMRENSRRTLERFLGVGTSSWSLLKKAAFENFALILSDKVLSDVAGLRNWTSEEKQALLGIIEAKTGVDEMAYLRLTQRHKRLRDALLS